MFHKTKSVTYFLILRPEFAYQHAMALTTHERIRLLLDELIEKKADEVHHAQQHHRYLTGSLFDPEDEEGVLEDGEEEFFMEWEDGYWLYNYSDDGQHQL